MCIIKQMVNPIQDRWSEPYPGGNGSDQYVIFCLLFIYLLLFIASDMGHSRPGEVQDSDSELLQGSTWCHHSL